VLIIVLLYWKAANIMLVNLWILPPLLLSLFLLTLGITWIVSALQVYARDVGQLVGQFLGFMFFMTPVLYTNDMLPKLMQPWLALNPVSIYCATAREFLMQGANAQFRLAHLIALVVAMAVAVLGLACFRKLAKHFEDFV
jgi:lipopolysaccharide transport system permease protein